MPKPAGRGPYAKSVEVQQRILDACIAAFDEVGFHGVSMAAIARRVGISHNGLLHHYPDKHALLAAVLEREDLRAAAYIEAHRLEAAIDGVELLRSLIDGLHDGAGPLGVRELSVVLSAEATSQSHPGHVGFGTRYASIRRFLTRLFQRLHDDGQLATSGPPDVIALAAVALLEGLQKQALFDPELDIAAAATTLLSPLVPALRRADDDS